MIRFKQTGEIFSNIASAKDAVVRFAKRANAKKREKAELVFDPGEYIFEESAVFSAKEHAQLSGVGLSLSCEEGKATFNSLKVLDKSKFKKTGKYYTYQFEKNADGKYPRFRDLYVDGKRISVCKTEIFIHAFEIPFETEEVPSGLYIPEEAAQLLPCGDLSPAELVLYAEWEFFIFPLLYIDRNRIKFDEEGKKHIFAAIEPEAFNFYVKKLCKYLQPKNREIFLCNHPTLLGEDSWCYDFETGLLCYFGKNGLDADIAVPMLEKLFVFEGMEGIRLENLEFTGVTDKFVCGNGYLSGQANMEKRLDNKVEEAAVLARDVRDFVFEKCGFYNIGANGILMLGELARIYIRNSRFEDIGMSAVSIGEPVGIERNKKRCSYDIRVENNHLCRIGYDFPSSPAIDVFRVDGISICRNTIEYCAYSGISVGWNWRSFKYALGEMINIRDANIAYNRISHHMHILRDGGAIYVVGCNCTKEDTRFFNFMHDNFAYRDSVKRTVRGYYLDGASSNWHVYDNVVSGAQRPAFAQFIVEDEHTHNILAENTYVTEPIDPETHCPERNTIFRGVYLEPTIEELFDKYPEARRIYENSGCRDL